MNYKESLDMDTSMRAGSVINIFVGLKKLINKAENRGDKKEYSRLMALYYAITLNHFNKQEKP